jgi:hypothetical protein
MTVKTPHTYTVGLAGSGFLAEAVILPKTVSFSRLQLGEGRATSKASGYYDTTLHWNGIVHPPTAEPWPTVDAGNGAGSDNVGSVPPGTHGPFSTGNFLWQIPQRYRRAGSSGTGHVFTTDDHVQHMKDATGEETTSKEGASRTRKP